MYWYRLQKKNSAGTSLSSCYLATILGYTDRPTGSPFTRHKPIENGVSNNTCIDVFAGVGMYYRVGAFHQKEGYTLPSHCLATIGGIYEVSR
jgi:hypothetical protein